jgi:hypothetical protein
VTHVSDLRLTSLDAGRLFYEADAVVSPWPTISARQRIQHPRYRLAACARENVGDGFSFSLYRRCRG